VTWPLVVGKILLFVVLLFALAAWIVKQVFKPHDDLAPPAP